MPELSFLAVHAHPDDESITMGGTLARYASEGIRTTLVTATRGEVGEILDKSLDPKEAAPRLASIREQELRNACRILGVGELVFLGYQDSGMAGEPRNREEGTFWQADEEEAVGRLVEVVRRVRPQVIATYNELGGYGHPDHINTHRIAVQAFFYAANRERFPNGEAWQPSKLYYSAFPLSQIRAMGEAMEKLGMENRFSNDGSGAAALGVPDDRVTTAVDVSAFLDKKIAAMQAHRTQIPPESWFMRIRDALGPQAWNREYFERVRSLVEAPAREEDLFAGLR
jgi:N-acetyl-1-D-myo-inositol-2-amino-2-deoxy-alpha-D-glucopyranoside deacetylase